jgi:quinol monooxygenase YgiN
MIFSPQYAPFEKSHKEKMMVHVVATIRVNPGCMSQFLEIFKSNIPTVLAETGAVEYRPTMDLGTGLPRQVLEENTIVLIEKWSSLEALRNHLVTPHMLSYRERVKGLVISTSLRVLQDA